MTIPSVTELLHEWDAARPRSQQREMGMSALGGCRRRAGYISQGYQPDSDPVKMQAILGTAIHEAAAQAALMSSGVPPGAIVEDFEVEFAGLKGHPDLYADRVLRDIKTLGYSMQLERIKAKGPPTPHLWQTACYAAALILAGYPVEIIELDYIERGSGNEYIWRGTFDPQHVRDAMAWLQQVRTTPVQLLSRDYRPESNMCKECEFYQQCWQSARPGRSARSALYADWPKAADWARRLEQARAARKAAELAEADAKGALDALRTVERPGESEDVTVPGLDGQAIRFSVNRGRESFDAVQVAADYARVGAKPPMVRGEPVVKVAVVSAGE